MPTIDELEAALQATWDLDALAVYADVLQSVGDPRGELIALDLDPVLWRSAHRRERVQAWLGGDTWDPAQFSYGLLDELVLGGDTFAALDGSPIGDRVRVVTLRADAAGVRAGLARFVRRHWPWLARLAIDQELGSAPSIEDGVAAALIAATPHLRTLAVSGSRVFRRLQHPSLRRLELQAMDAIEDLALPSVVELCVDLQHITDTTWAARRTAPLVGLRVLDLACNRYHAEAVLVFVDALPEPQRITELRLPGLAACYSEVIYHLLARLPDTRIDFAPVYRGHAELLPAIEHPRVRQPAPFPWPNPMGDYSGITIHGVDFPLKLLVDHLEAQFAQLPTEHQATWSAFWELFDQLGLEHSARRGGFPAPALRAAIAAMPRIDPRLDRLVAMLDVTQDVEIQRFEEP